MDGLYTTTDAAVVESHFRAHATGEQTHVVVLSRGGDAYEVLAYDIDPTDFKPVAATVVAYDPTAEGARARGHQWMRQNPKGVAPANGAAGSSGIAGRMKQVFERVNRYGNDMTEQLQNDGGKQ